MLTKCNRDISEYRNLKRYIKLLTLKFQKCKFSTFIWSRIVHFTSWSFDVLSQNIDVPFIAKCRHLMSMVYVLSHLFKGFDPTFLTIYLENFDGLYVKLAILFRNFYVPFKCCSTLIHGIYVGNVFLLIETFYVDNFRDCLSKCRHLLPPKCQFVNIHIQTFEI